ncbi:uncharacterized protein J3D65DRAFT_615011 [Phyllosticta citribraziliensis]|uniref:Uncharacterized protein n=1 Tax=Phyllosticta citribraziliensis TaxID=989973 RepID=A0ABR1M791_9PEZI
MTAICITSGFNISSSPSSTFGRLLIAWGLPSWPPTRQQKARPAENCDQHPSYPKQSRLVVSPAVLPVQHCVYDSRPIARQEGIPHGQWLAKYIFSPQGRDFKHQCFREAPSYMANAEDPRLLGERSTNPRRRSESAGRAVYPKRQSSPPGLLCLNTHFVSCHSCHPALCHVSGFDITSTTSAHPPTSALCPPSNECLLKSFIPEKQKRTCA